MGTLGFCEIYLHRSMVSGQKEHRMGFVFSSLQLQYLLEAAHEKKNLFWFTVLVQSIQKGGGGGVWWDRTIYFMAAREPKKRNTGVPLFLQLSPLSLLFCVDPTPWNSATYIQGRSFP